MASSLGRVEGLLETRRLTLSVGPEATRANASKLRQKNTMGTRGARRVGLGRVPRDSSFHDRFVRCPVMERAWG